MMRTGILGGTFNPIHNGHIKLAMYCKRELNLDRVILIPDYKPPHKSDRMLVDSVHRLNMCRLAAMDGQGIEVSPIELERGGKSYTYETLTSLKELYTDDRLFLITGADMFLTLDSWKNPGIIFEKAALIAVPRDDSSSAEMQEYYDGTLKPMGAEAYILDSTVEQISSTFIRSHIREPELIGKYLSPRVLEYINRHGLYQNRQPDYNAVIRPLMGDYRYSHSVNVAEEAVELAKLYGCDTEKAFVAGILHDVTKEIPKNEQLQIMTDGGIILDSVQKNSTKLWHSISGSVYIRDVLGINDEDIINAVRYHTTGRAGMSLLEKIIYIADYTAEGRSYPGVDTMREKSRESLEEAMIFSCQFTLQSLSQKGLAIHPDQLFCYNELVTEKKG